MKTVSIGAVGAGGCWVNGQKLCVLRRWLTDIDATERTAQIQMKRLVADLKEILPTLGNAFDLEDHRDANVVALPKPGK